MERKVTIQRVKGNYQLVQEHLNAKDGRTTAPAYEANSLGLSATLKKDAGGMLNYGMPKNQLRRVFAEIFSCDVADVKTADIDKWYNHLVINIPTLGRDGKGALILDASTNVQTFKNKSLTNLGVVVETEEDIEIPENPVDYVKYKVLLDHPYVARSTKELNDKHYAIILDIAEIENTNKNLLAIKKKANDRFNQITEKEEYRRHLFILKGEKVPALKEINLTAYKGDLEVLLYNIMDSNPELFLKVVDDKQAINRYFLEQLVTYGLWVRDSSGNITNSNLDEIGKDNSSAIKWLNDKGNAQSRAALEKQLKDIINPK